MSIKIDQSFRIDDPRLEIYCIPNAVDLNVCQGIIECIDKNSQRSTVTSGGRRVEHTARTSSTCYLEKCEDYKTLTEDLQRQMLQWTELDIKHSERLQGQRYLKGEFYLRHYDFFIPGTETYQNFTEIGGQRDWTTMLYLNTVDKGGVTFFPEIGMGFKPLAGTMIIWNNLDADLKENYATLHEALPPSSSSKYVVTQWFRLRPYR